MCGGWRSPLPPRSVTVHAVFVNTYLTTIENSSGSTSLNHLGNSASTQIELVTHPWDMIDSIAIEFTVLLPTVRYRTPVSWTGKCNRHYFFMNKKSNWLNQYSKIKIIDFQKVDHYIPIVNSFISLPTNRTCLSHHLYTFYCTHIYIENKLLCHNC